MNIIHRTIELFVYLLDNLAYYAGTHKTVMRLYIAFLTLSMVAVATYIPETKTITYILYSVAAAIWAAGYYLALIDYKD